MQSHAAHEIAMFVHTKNVAGELSINLIICYERHSRRMEHSLFMINFGYVCSGFLLPYMSFQIIST